tara:strand:+ start:3546 stop:4316 length:771 start_codon:yes stop_codon:yes gene_type:complete
MRYLLITLCILIIYNAASQELYSDSTGLNIGLPDSLTHIDQFPVYEGGIDAFYEDVAKSMEYPTRARRMGVQGVVHVSFIVNKVGELEEVFALRGIGGGCDDQAVKAVKETSGKWTPGEHQGKLVAVRMVLPITFKLEVTEQTVFSTIEYDTAFIVEEQPIFIGGMDKFRSDIAKSLKYPKSEKKAGIQGTVVVMFIINQLGEVERASIIDGIGPKCNAQALKAVRKTSGKWIPGKHGGKYVKVKMYLPVVFQPRH